MRQFAGEALSLDQHVREWDQAFARLQGHVDIVAFQDGNVSFDDLPRHLAANRELAVTRGIRCWSNVETFDRDMQRSLAVPMILLNLIEERGTATSTGGAR